ncbi:MAG: hypothetical protein AB7V56_09235 [Candidatus Nitrosocosmicus sp.]
MHYFKVSKRMVMFLTAIISSILIGANFSGSVMGQINDTAQGTDKDYTGFHSNIEQIKGHIEKAAYNKFFNNQTLTIGHTLHPIEEVLSLVTIPLTQSNSSLNQTYFDDLYQLSTMATENSTVADFENKSHSSLQLSDEVISTVVPKQVLSSPSHNISVIKDLLTVSGSEYAEGVADSKIILELEFQDGSAFIDRAYALFNDTQNISNDTGKITTLLTDFSNLTDSVNNLKDPTIINQLIEKINSEIGGDTQINGTSVQSDGQQTSGDYIAKIRGLLDQVISSYEANDNVKAKELATTAYLDNFEFIEAPIGKELSDKGESLLREKLRDQIDANVTLDEIRQTIADIHEVLNESEVVLSSNQQ